jgi:hypothetical protein
MIDPAEFWVQTPAFATRTESQLPLSPIWSTNVWMLRAAVLYNEFTQIEAFMDGRNHG